MKRSVTRFHCALLASSVLLFASLVAVWQFAPRFPRSADFEFSRLQAEQRQLAGNDDATRDRWRAQLNSLPTCDADALVAVRATLGSAWQWEDTASSLRLRTATLTSAPAGWAAFLSALGTLERQPGIFLREAEFTGGTARPGGPSAHARIAIAWLP